MAKGKDRRFRQGHPWIFANELAHSAKEARPGEVVELRDAADHFLAYGYVHPTSQICFRRLSSNAKEKDVLSERFFVERLQSAREARALAGWTSASHRWLFAESDGVPGLIVDAFLTSAQGWVLVVQASTAGMEKALPEIFAALKTFAKSMGLISIVEAPSSSWRVLEGLENRPKQLVHGQVEGLEEISICLHGDVKLHADLLNGQKTGFFLDQQWNALLLRDLIKHGFKYRDKVRVLDICSYVGQWSAQAATELRRVAAEKIEVTMLDISANALALAKKNLLGLADECELVQGDALKKIVELGEARFDIVICDPPAFVKKKADLEAGSRAYVKLNREAMRATKPGGILVSASCSGLVRSGDWSEILAQASGKAGRQLKQLFSGGHAPDHPLRAEFPEGEYLKCSLGQILYPS